MEYAQLLELFAQMNIVDCSQTITSQIPIWPGGQRLEKTKLRTYDKDGYAKEIFLMGNDLGTHIDSPSHFIKGKHTISDLDVRTFVSIAAILDVTSKVTNNHDYLLTVDDILEWETKYGKIPDNAIVCMKTGWSQRFHSEMEYQNMDDQKRLHYPAFSKEAAEFLVRERTINALGIDTLSTDSGLAEIAYVHNTILGAGKYQTENLDLSHLDTGKIMMVALPMKIEGAPESEARVIAFLPK